MAQKSKLADKAFRKTFKMALKQLGEMMNAEGISSKQKLLLYENLNGYRSIVNDGEAANSSSIELKSINRENENIPEASCLSFQKEEAYENTTNIEKGAEKDAKTRKKAKTSTSNTQEDALFKEESPSLSKNMWGQKDMNTVLKERNVRIQQLENEVEECKKTNKSLLEDRKCIKSDIDTVGIIEKAINEKNTEIFNLKNEIDQLMSKMRDLELQLNVSKEAIEIVKDNGKKVTDLFSQKKQSPITLNVSEASTPSSREELYSLKNSNAELGMKISLLENEKINYKQRIANLESMLQDYNKRSETVDSLKLLRADAEDLEMSLIDELTSITKAYDEVSKTNKSFEEQIASLNSQNLAVTTENLSLKNKLKSSEESKSFVEKERKKLESMRMSLNEEANLLKEKSLTFEKQFIEKDKKILDYRMHLVNLQSSLKKTETELSLVKGSYRSLQDELLALNIKFNNLTLESSTNKRLCEIYKDIYKEEENTVETIDRFKKILSCSLCDSNIKDCILSKCMHTFCDLCISSRFKSRQRKCPSCQTEFDLNDVKKLYL